MNIPDMPFTVTEWGKVEPVEHPGETGMSLWRELQVGDIRLRQVDYSAGYLADHWCDRGHILHVLRGTLAVDLKDGRSATLSPGMSFQVSDHGDAAHRVRSEDGCTVFIVD